MAQDIDLGKISIVPKGDWTEVVQVEYNDIWAYSNGKYLALRNSQGVTPSDDHVYWFQLSSAGKSAYVTAVENGFIGTEEEWIQSLKQPAIDAAAMATAAVESMDTRYGEKIEEIKEELESTVDDAVADRVARPLLISEKETKVGAYKIGGEDIDIYERSVKLPDLPQTVDEIVDYIVADEPLGYGLFFKVESLVASTGRGLTGSFFTSHYEIADYSINESLQSIITIRCKENVPQSVNGLLHIQYCKFYGDVIEFDVTVPTGVNKEAITLEIPPLKFNKKALVSWTYDDCPCSAYDVGFSLINNRFVSSPINSLNIHFGQSLPDPSDSNGDFPGRVLEFTDGAGVLKRYAIGAVIWPNNGEWLDSPGTYGRFMGDGVTIPGNYQQPYLKWTDLPIMLDFGNSIYSHDTNDEKYDTSTVEGIIMGLKEDYEKVNTMLGFGSKVMMRPNGDPKYVEAARIMDEFFSSFSESSTPGYPTLEVIPGITSDLYKQNIYRYFIGSSDTGVTLLDKLQSELDKTNPSWLHIASHTSRVHIRDFFNLVFDNYGKDAQDNVWVASCDEYLEYWYMANFTSHTKTITDTGIHFKLYVPKMQNFRYRDLSVLLLGISDLTGVSIISGSNVYGTSFAINSGKLLVNLNFDQKLMQRVEKYVSIFEATPTAVNAYDDAQYFVQQLKPGIKEIYQVRLDAFTSPPVLSSVSINSGATSTTERNVNLTVNYSGSPTHYRVSENPSFSDAIWIEMNNPFPFILSDIYGTRRVYVQLKNQFGESGTKYDDIEYVEAPLNLLGIVINNGDDSTSETVVSILFNYAGRATHYMLSESSDFAGASWIDMVNPASFTLSAIYGNKTVFAKLRNSDTGIETAIAEDSIVLIDSETVVLNSIMINDGDEYTGDAVVTITPNFTNTTTHYRIGETPDLSGESWQPYSSGNISYTLSGGFGVKTIYLQLSNSSNESEVKSASINYVQDVVIDSVLLAGGVETHAGVIVPVALTTSGGVPTHYRVGETPDLSTATWQPYVSNFNYNFGSAGIKILYAQVKNQVSESAIVSDTITIAEAPTVMAWSINGPSQDNDVIYETLADGRVVNRKQLGTYSSYTRKQLKSIIGESLEWYIEQNSSFYPSDSESAIVGSYITFGNPPVLSGNTGEYPDELLSLHARLVGNGENNTLKVRVYFTLPVGSYRMRILSSRGTAMTDAQRLVGYYKVGVNGVIGDPVQCGPEGFTGLNNTSFNATLEFTVNAENEGNVVIYAYNTNNINYHPGFNLIEIAKLN